MKFSTLMRHCRESFKSIVRNGWLSFASASSISISLFILGVFLILALNVNHLANQAISDVEIQVFLEMDTNAQQITTMQNRIGSIAEVNQVRFISRDEGLEILKEKFGDDVRQLFEGYEGDENPLNDSFLVKVYDAEHINFVVDKIREIDERNPKAQIFKIVYGQEVVEVLLKITKAVRNIGLVLVAALSFTAIFLISNTIKLTILARRREIAIMKLVGATNSFIRWPFFIEGALLGLIGSLVPVGILIYGYGKLIDSAQLNFGIMMIELLSVEQVTTEVITLLLGIGVVIGIWGSTISVRKFLKV